MKSQLVVTHLQCRGTSARFGAGLLFALFALVVVAVPAARATWSNGNYTQVFATNTTLFGGGAMSVSSDGQGGLLAMILNDDSAPARAYISRINGAGGEMWGPLGQQVPFSVIASDQARPVSIAPDGTGGAYCLWQDVYGASGVYHLARMDATGVQMWSVDVGNAGSNPFNAGAQLVADPTSGVTVGYVDPAAPRLYAARYDPAGVNVWNTFVNQAYEHNVTTFGGNTEFALRSDEQGGVLFAWLRYDSLSHAFGSGDLEEIGLQRIDGSGNRLWGGDGHMVWKQPYFPEVSIYHARVLADGAGGAYVVTSGGERSYGQHLNALGAETWVVGGIELQATSSSFPHANVDTDPHICGDGAGGLLLVQNQINVYATHVDINGNKTWGASGIVAATTSNPNEYYGDVCIDADGFGGAVIGYSRWDNGVESLGGVRVDGFGTVLWNDETLWAAGTNEQVFDVEVVADGIGGAKYAWKENVPGPSHDDVYALGVDGQGVTPTPVLYGMAPDAGEPGDVLAERIFGDYIDDSYGYELRRGATSLSITGLGWDGQVTGTLSLAGAAIGAWDLFATQGGSDVAGLTDAFGVGLRPVCGVAGSMYATDLDGSGTKRKLAFDSTGECHFAFILNNLSTSQQEVYLGLLTGFSWSLGSVATTPAFDWFELAHTVDALDRDVVAWVHPSVSGFDSLVIRTYDTWVPVPGRSHDLSFTPYIARPVLAAFPNGDVHIVMEQGAGSNAFDHLVLTDAGVFAVSRASDPNEREADLAVTPDGMVMAYVRDSWFPGISEVCVQHYRNGIWESPVALNFGVSITSPSIAFDGANEIFVAWILDNTPGGTAPVLQTSLLVNDVPGPIRTRGLGTLSVQVDAQGPYKFFLLSRESNVSGERFLLRGGTGDVFYPALQINSATMADWPLFAAEHGGSGVASLWQVYNDPVNGNTVMQRFCNDEVSTAVRPGAPPAGGLGATAYPNPFNPSTHVRFTISKRQWVRVRVYDVQGRLVRELNNGPLPRGTHALEFDGHDDTGAPLASGVYFARVRPSTGKPAVVKLTLVK